MICSWAHQLPGRVERLFDKPSTATSQHHGQDLRRHIVERYRATKLASICNLNEVTEVGKSRSENPVVSPVVAA